MTSSRATSLALSSLPSCSQVTRVDDASDTTLASSESVSIDKEVRCEFDIDWTNIWHGSMRLEGAKLRPRHRRVVNTKAKESWIFQHGASLKYEGARYWLCKLCHLKKSYSTALYSAAGTTHAAKHLTREHRISPSGELPNLPANPFLLAASSGTCRVPLSCQSSAGLGLPSRFNEFMWKAQFVHWIILEDVTLRQTSSKRLQWLILNGGELASQLLPESHASVSRWIHDTFQRRWKIIFDLIKNAKSSVQLSFDLWTASNGFDYVGIVGHFADGKGLKRDVLIGLPRVIGPHSGENIATYIKKIIDCYELGSKLGYFVLDNASTNDTCLEALALWFPIDVNKRRLRCIDHIINLVVRAVIFGENVSKFEDELRGASEETYFKIWARKGAIGRQRHNFL